MFTRQKWEKKHAHHHKNETYDTHTKKTAMNQAECITSRPLALDFPALETGRACSASASFVVSLSFLNVACGVAALSVHRASVVWVINLHGSWTFGRFATAKKIG